MARTGRPKAELVLSDDERAALEGWVRRRSTPQAWALRCRIILACAAGATNKDVAVRSGRVACGGAVAGSVRGALNRRAGCHAVGRWPQDGDG